LFSGTVIQNVQYGLEGSPYKDLPDEKKREMAIEACKVSNAHEFIMGLPQVRLELDDFIEIVLLTTLQGYDTPIGNRGTLLSGGQKQRIAIARATVKDPPILILDEATSALDVTSEAIVQQALENAGSNRTTISIAHRLTTIKNADQIAVIRKGSIVEVGTHVTLTSKDDGIYKRLWEAQKLVTSHQAKPEENEEAPNFHASMTRKSTKGGLDVAAADELVEHAKSQREFWNTLLGILSAQKKYWWAFVLLFIASAIGGKCSLRKMEFDTDKNSI
jgi:ATP-binding cassette, subfamily B (MDR/TAP), member 1